MASGFRNIFTMALVIVAMCVACVPDPLELKDVKEPASKIVVSSQTIPDYAIAVLLTKSISALDGNQDSEPIAFLSKVMVSDAKVRIEGNGQSHTLEYIGYGLYGTNDVDPVPGEAYTLFADSPTMGSITSSTTAKAFVPFDQAGATVNIFGRDTLAEVSYQFKDQPGSNWYMLNAQKVTNTNLEDKLLNPRVTTKVMTDDGFDGEIKADKFLMLFDEIKLADTIAVTISNIDKDYYEFMKLREDTRFGFAAFLGEPINYPTNVKGGLGYFTLYSSDRRVFTLEEYGKR